MISDHSGGFWTYYPDDPIETEDDIKVLKKLFEILKKLNCRIVINTRGIINKTSSKTGINYGIFYFLQKYNLLRYVNSIFGDKISDIDQYLELPEQQPQPQSQSQPIQQQQPQQQSQSQPIQQSQPKQQSQQVQLSGSQEWAIRKKVINRLIMEEARVSPNQVYFFDDSIDNIRCSAELGINCVLINNEQTVFSWKIMEQILNIGRSFVIQQVVQKPLTQQKRTHLLSLNQSIQNHIAQKVFLSNISINNKIKDISMKMILDVLMEFNAI